MKRRSWLWLILGIVLGIALSVAAIKICIDRWFAPGTFALSEENIDRLENLDADAVYRLLSEEAADGRWEIISHVPSEDGGLGDIFVSGRADCQWAFGGAVKFSLRLLPNPDTEVYLPGEYYTRYTRYGLDAVLEEKWSLWMGMSYVSFYTEDYVVSVRMYTAPDYNLGVSSVLDWLDEELSEVDWLDEELSEADAETGDFSLDVSSVLDWLDEEINEADAEAEDFSLFVHESE